MHSLSSLMTVDTAQPAGRADAPWYPPSQTGHLAAAHDGGVADPAKCRLPSEDWDLMFNAVQCRLGECLRNSAGSSAGTRQMLAACVDALAQLQGLRATERASRATLQQRLHQCSAAMETARLELEQSSLHAHRAQHAARPDTPGGDASRPAEGDRTGGWPSAASTTGSTSCKDDRWLRLAHQAQGVGAGG